MSEWLQRVWMPGVGFGPRLAQLAVAQSVTGPRIFDLQIAWVLSSQASPKADELLTRIEAGATVVVPSL